MSYQLICLRVGYITTNKYTDRVLSMFSWFSAPGITITITQNLCTT